MKIKRRFVIKIPKKLTELHPLYYLLYNAYIIALSFMSQPLKKHNFSYDNFIHYGLP